jgi:siroheme synthase-like protein
MVWTRFLFLVMAPSLTLTLLGCKKEFNMANYSVELILRDRPVLVIGGGRIAVRKLAGLVDSGAILTVVAPELLPISPATHAPLSHLAESFRPDHLEREPRPVLVFAATGSAELNREVARLCRERGIWCNSADDPEVSGFLVPATVRRGSLSVAVASEGKSPALTRLIKERVDQWLEPGWAELVDLFGVMREQVRQTITDPEPRYRFWREIALAASAEERFRRSGNLEWFRRKLADWNGSRT